MYKPRSNLITPLYTVPMIADQSTLRSAFFYSRLIRRGLAFIMSSLLLAGCTNVPEDNSSRVVQTPIPIVTPAPIPAKPEQKINQTALERVDQMARELGAAAAWAERDTLLRTGLDATSLALIDSNLAWLAGDTTNAEQLISSASEMDKAGREQVLQIKQARAAMEHQWLEAARILHQRLMRDTNNLQEHGEQLFDYLMHLDDTQLRAAQMGALDADWRGWLELLQSYHRGRLAVSAWVNNHPTHSALPSLPAGLSHWLNQAPPRQLALLLPISGRLSSAANAVLEGTVEALYRNYRDPLTRPRLVTIDTEQYSDVIAAYQAALDGGADVVIGPLTKARSRSLANLRQRPVPIITLNRPEALPESEARGWNALSLAPEDEARQLAALAFADGLRHGVIIAPDTDWGRRMSASLTQEWRILGGKIIDQANLSADEPASPYIAETLGASGSELRIKQVEAAFEPAVITRARRRADIDSVFLLASSPDEARALRPLLVFHYGGDLPIFAPSTVNANSQNRGNQDLNSVRFVEIPAVLNAPKVNRYTSLQALGRDAVLLAEHLDQSAHTTAAIVRGETGLLNRRRNGEIERELNSVVFAGDSIKSH